MTRAVVIIRTDADRRLCKSTIDRLKAGDRVEFKKARRSNESNALMWARLTEIAQQVEWYGQKLSAEDWKDVFTASLRKARVVPGIDPGSFVPLGMRTSDMTTEEMNNLLELIAAFGAEHDVTFHERSEAA